jgi:hypothetical protein
MTGDNKLQRKTRRRLPGLALLFLVTLSLVGLFAVIAARRDDPARPGQPDVGSDDGIAVTQVNSTPAAQQTLNLPDTTDGVHRAVVFLRCAQETGWTGGSKTFTDY